MWEPHFTQTGSTSRFLEALSGMLAPGKKEFSAKSKLRTEEFSRQATKACSAQARHLNGLSNDCHRDCAAVDLRSDGPPITSAQIPWRRHGRAGISA